MSAYIQYVLFNFNLYLILYIQNSKITKDEWLQMWAACLNDLEKHGQFPAWQEKYMKLMFDVNDKSGKG